MGTAALPDAAAQPAAAANTTGNGDGADGGRQHARKDVDTVVDRLIAKYGTERAALAVLADENLDHRETIRGLRSQVPTKDSVVIPAADAATLTAFKALGKTPQEITAALTETETLRTENEATKRRETHRKAAEAIGYDPDVLDDFAGSKRLTIELRDTEVTDRGQKVKKPMPFVVTGEGAAAKAEPLDEVVKRDHQKYEVALRANGTQRGGGQNGVPYPGQKPVGTAPGDRDTDVVGQHLSSNYVTPSQRAAKEKAGA